MGLEFLALKVVCQSVQDQLSHTTHHGTHIVTHNYNAYWHIQFMMLYIDAMSISDIITTCRYALDHSVLSDVSIARLSLHDHTTQSIHENA